jgi:rod shape determining protein RodA
MLIARHQPMSVRARGLEGNMWRDFDLMLFATMCVMTGFGVISIWSAVGLPALVSYNSGTMQAIYAFFGILMMFAMAAIDYRYLQTAAWLIYVFGILFLLLVFSPLGFAVEGTGAQNWLNFGFTTVQPSEFVKITTLIALANFVSSRGEAMREFGNFVIAGMIVALPAGLILIGPDLGQAMVFVALWACTLFVMRTSPLYIAATIAAAPIAAFIGWRFVLEGYQKTRILVSYNPELDTQGAGFQIIQARISIGAGGWTGAGLAGGSQSTSNLLSVRESDFIFAHASSMFGFIGMIALFLAIVILIWRCLVVAEIARDTFGQVLAIGVAGLIFFQAFLNIGMNVGLMPVAGITLPFISAGISSLWTYMILIGILQSVRMHHRRLDFLRG